MTANAPIQPTVCDVTNLHVHHPSIRAGDWRSPLVGRLLGNAAYVDGQHNIEVTYLPQTGQATTAVLQLTWTGLSDDYKLCLNTYQAPVLTEFAALAVACILTHLRAGLEITEVTRRGEKVDYWLGNREFLIEVSGTADGDLHGLRDTKAAEQLLKNPFGRDGFVCVSSFKAPQAGLWFYKFP